MLDTAGDTCLEGEGLIPEAQVLGGDEAGQEDVDALAHTEGHGDHSVRARLAVEAADEVREVVEHRQVVLHHNHVLLGAQQRPDHLRSGGRQKLRVQGLGFPGG